MAWTKFPFPEETYIYTAATLKKNWLALHKGDVEPFPKDPALVEAWIAYHAGEFEQAVNLGLGQGVTGYSAAHKAACIYANYLERNEKKKIAIFEEVAARCEQQQTEQPENPAGFYWHAYALGRYAQGISVIKALSQGICHKIRASLDNTIRLAPKHADAHIALGVYHAEIIDEVGAMIGGLTYGVTKEESFRNYQTALKLIPDSPIARIEFANGLVMLEGSKKMSEAIKLYGEAAACKPIDAMERLDVEQAKEELED